jgi:hypothetical protein
MQTVRRRIDVGARLVEAGLKEAIDSRDVVVAPQGNAVIIHVANHARTRLPELVRWLEGQDFAGRVIAGEALDELGLPSSGTLAVAVNLAGDEEPNAFGIRGRSDVAENALAGESLPGHGQHGGLGAHEQRPFLFVRGGGFVPGTRESPASLVDIAPTILRHLGLPSDGMQGSALPLRSAAAANGHAAADTRKNNIANGAHHR